MKKQEYTGALWLVHRRGLRQDQAPPASGRCEEQGGPARSDRSGSIRGQRGGRPKLLRARRLPPSGSAIVKHAVRSIPTRHNAGGLRCPGSPRNYSIAPQHFRDERKYTRAKERVAIDLIGACYGRRLVGVRAGHHCATLTRFHQRMSVEGVRSSSRARIPSTMRRRPRATTVQIRFVVATQG
jgi:hypothetical protein